uniref:RICTOR_N domain-containing protein n=1 Tax=Meloidogyne hapla TaxID=6305 RepID=A0A1I8B809_MELHA
MKAGRLGKEDLQKLKQIKRRIIKGTHENVKEEVYESFTTAESFLEFINGWENIFDQDDLLIFLLRILSTLEHQNIFIVNNQIYNALFERSFKSIKLHADPKICEICFLIVSKICNNTVRIIQAIKFNFDILLFRYNFNFENFIKNDCHFKNRYIYTLNLAQYKEGTYALHFLALSFSILIRNNLFDSLLIDWWRFRFFLHNSINCLMDIAFRQNCPFSLSNEQKNLSNSFSISDCDIDNLGISKGSPKNLQLYSIGILLELLVQRPDLLFKMDIGLNWLVPAINQSSNVLGTILINILCKWLDSPNIRKNGELNLFDHIASQTLNLNSDEIKSYTIELLCDSLNVPYARHEFSGLFNQWENAFFFYKQIRLPDLFSIFLRDDFLFAEIAYLDNQKDDSFIDLLEIYRSVVLFEIVSEKLPEALIRLILPNPDYPISIKATFLLADILYMSRLLPKSIRFEALSINNLIHSIVESSYLNENISNKEEKKWNGFLLIDRLNEVNNFLNKSTALKSLTLINTFLIVNEEEFRKGRRSTSILRNNRHSSSSVTNNIEECNDNANDVFETFSEEFSSDHFDSNIDILISKAFNKTTKTYKNVTENFQQKLKKNDSLEDLNEYLIENTDWNIIWRILAFVDDKIISFQNKSTIDKCIPIFNRIINLFLPSNQFFTQNKPSTQLIKCGQYCIQLLCELNSSTFVGADNVQWAEDMVS